MPSGMTDSPMLVTDCDDSDSQEWETLGGGMIRNLSWDKCVAVGGERPSSGTRVVALPCTDAENQQWSEMKMPPPAE